MLTKYIFLEALKCAMSVGPDDLDLTARRRQEGQINWGHESLSAKIGHRGRIARVRQPGQDRRRGKPGQPEKTVGIVRSGYQTDDMMTRT